MKMSVFSFFVTICLSTSTHIYSQVLYQDYFNGTSQFAEVNKPFDVVMSIKSGYYKFESYLRENSYTSLISFNLDTQKDFAIACGMDQESSIWGGFYGLVFGSNDKDGYYFVINSDLGIYSFKNKDKVIQKSSKAINRGKSFNSLKVQKVGSKIELYINDEKVATKPFNDFFGNKFGFFVSGMNEISFKYLTISKINVNDTTSNYNSDLLLTKGYNEKREVKKAMGDFNKELNTTQSDVNLILDRANNYYNIGKYDDAMVDLEAVVYRSINDTTKWNFTGTAYSMLAKIHRLKKNIDLERIDSNLSVVYLCTPVNSEAYYQQGEYYRMLSYFNDKAVQSYSNALKMDSKNGKYYLKRGLCYLSLGKHNYACRDFKEAYKLGFTYAKKYIDENCK